MRVRPEHWALLLDMCERNPELITNRFNGSEGKAKGHALWQTVTQRLNSLGFGEKSKEDWRKALIDWKSKTKSKAAKIKKEIKGTGGGPPKYGPLSELEKRLLGLMGTTAIEGDDVQEMGFGQITVNQSTEEKIQGPTAVHLEYSELAHSTREIVNQSLEEKLPVSTSSEHDYTKHTSPPSGIKRPLKSQYSRRVRPHRGTDLSIKLTDITKDTLETLKNIDKNIEVIAESLKVIASVIKDSRQ